MRQLAPSSFVVVASLVGALAACDSAGSDATPADRADSAGVEVVTNRGGDRELGYTFTPLLTLGGKDEGPESFFRVGRGRADVDASGNIHVLDADAKRVVVFDSTGRHLRTFGRPGQGPGEYQFPLRLDVTSDGHVTVHDPTKEGLSRWAPDGTLLPSTRLKATGAIQSVAFVGGDPIYSWSDFKEDSPPTTILQRERGDSIEELARLTDAKATMSQFKGCPIIMRLPPLLSPELTWDVRGERIAVVSGAEYEIAVHDGAKRMLVRRAIAPVPTTLEIAQREVGDSMRVTTSTTRCAIPPAEVAEVRGFAPVVPAVRAAMVAPDGSLWVQRGGPRTDPVVIDLFDRDGNYLGTLPDGSPMPITFMPNGDIVATSKDVESDVDRLVVYRRK